MHLSLRKLHREDGQTGHLGEFFVALGAGILLFGLFVLAMGLWVWQTAPGGDVDAVTAGSLYGVFGLGAIVFGSFAILSGWGRHHPDFDAP